ncbi:serine carboxypeptidase [Trifolium repens]|nr:serine carboxypeptidase [Trifolium repens]
MLRLTSGNKLRSLTSFLASSVRRRSAAVAVEEVDMEKERKSRLKMRRIEVEDEDEECPILMDGLCVVDRYYTRTYIICYE